MLGGAIGSWIGGGVVIAVLAGGWWAVDAYGDYRALKCHAAYDRATGQANTEIADLNSDEGRAEAAAVALVAKALDQARAVPVRNLATKEQAKALSEIR